MSNSTGSELDTMTPYLHFTRGDNLFFKSWAPSSPGAIAGACIGLVVLCLLERLLFAARGIMETHWRQQILAMTAAPTSDTSSVDAASSSEGKEGKGKEVEVQEPELLKGIDVRLGKRRARIIAPFVVSHDLTRGALYSLQALLTYALMLAVMTFQAAYIISIILGLGIGEILFGRFRSARLT